MAKIACPTEHAEQSALIQWRDIHKHKYPELGLLYSNPNGGYRAKRTAVQMKLEGTSKGIPDLTLPVSRHGYHGLYIEMKRLKGGSISGEQSEWIVKLQEQGYKAVVCKGCDQAIDVLCQYLDLPDSVKPLSLTSI